MSSSRSRPSSAKPTVEKPVTVERRVTVEKPVAAARHGSAVDTGEHSINDCKAAYLSVLGDLRVDIKSKTELCKVLQQAGRSPTNKVLAKYWKSNTVALTFEDFCDVCRKEQVMSAEDIIRAFRRIDVNNDGYVTASELRKMLTTRGDKMQIEEVQKIIDEVDENRDGKLDYREFAKMFTKTQQECKAVAYKNMEKKLSTKLEPVSPRLAHRTSLLGSVDQGRVEKVYVTGSQALATSLPGSRVNVMNDDDEESDDDIVIGASRITVRSSLVNKEDDPKGVSRTGQDIREWSRGGLSKQTSLVKPRTLRDWKMAKSKGCFFIDDKDKVVSHQYSLKVTQDTNVWITIEPLIMMPGDLNSKCEAAGSPVDMMIFILDADDSLVAFSDQRDLKGKYAATCALKKGVYKLLAFTTGCRFKPSASEPSKSAELIVRRKDGHVSLTKEFKDALRKIFEMADLSDNELLSREEFQLFQLHTSGQELDDSLWQIVEEKVELIDGNITWQGYLALNQMEAEDLEDNDEDLWVTLTSMGFNRALILDEASPFMVEVYCERCAPSLKVTKIDDGGRILTGALTAMLKSTGEESRVRGSKDLYLQSYAVDFRMTLMVENRSSTKQSVVVDCRKSDNITSNQPSGLSCTVDIPAKTSVVAHHLLPKKDLQSWSVVCSEVVK